MFTTTFPRVCSSLCLYMFTIIILTIHKYVASSCRRRKTKERNECDNIVMLEHTINRFERVCRTQFNSSPVVIMFSPPPPTSTLMISIKANTNTPLVEITFKLQTNSIVCVREACDERNMIETIDSLYSTQTHQDTIYTSILICV